MTPTTKKILIFGALAVAGVSLLGYQKSKRLQAIFDKMTIRPNSLPKNIEASLTQISFEIDVLLSNPTGEDFAVSGYVATLTQVMVYFRGKFLGVANVMIDEIAVPRMGQLVLQDIRVVVATKTIMSNIMTISDQLQSLGSLNINDLTFTGVVNVLGTNYEIGT